MGIIDPMKVTKQALQNAVSVAVTILSTNAIVTMARTYEANEHFDYLLMIFIIILLFLSVSCHAH